MRGISFVIPVCREKDERLARTLLGVRRIMRTVDAPWEVVLILDGDRISEYPCLNHPALADTTIFPHQVAQRQGVSASRWIGAELANQPFLCFLDAHMDFPGNFNIEFCQANLPLTDIACASMVNLDHNGEYQNHAQGAELYFHQYVTSQNALDLFNIKPLAWSWNHGPMREVPALIGACYFVWREHFIDIQGSVGQILWGGCEQVLSMKTYLLGGQVWAYRDQQVCHFNTYFDYSGTTAERRATTPELMLYNRLCGMWWVLDDQDFKDWTDLVMPKCLEQHDKNTIEELMAKLRLTYSQQRTLLQSRFVRSIWDFCSHWNLEHPTCVGALGLGTKL